MTGKDLWYKPKLIEVALPLEDINRESQRENYIYRGNPSALHLWWSRKPLASSRAVLFAQLVDDPSAHPDQFATEEEQQAERDRLHGIISRLVVWENIHDEKLLREAHQEILKSTGGNPPPILDPFAGGGSIPLEAQRLGLEAYASDLNPVAVIINKAQIELPSRWAGRAPIFPGSAAGAQLWPALTGLTEDIRSYGKWMRRHAEARIGHLYPKASPDAKDSVISWIWARTVTCPNPACSGTMPLANKFWLSQKHGKERYAVPIRDGKRIRFEIGGPRGTPREGTVSRTGAVCLICNTPVPLSYIRSEAKAGRMGAQLMAIAMEGERSRYYLEPTDEHEAAGKILRPVDAPEAELPDQALGFRIQGYGMKTWADLFTNRQLTLLATFTTLVGEAREQLISDGADTGYADTVACYLAFTISKLADYNCTGALWYAREDRPKNLFARQAIPIAWEYPEINPFAEIGGTWGGCLKVVSDAISGLVSNPDNPGHAYQANASSPVIQNVAVSTDPPYYDNVGYSDLSDFFYVWLRKSLRAVFPDLMETVLTPKADELVADPFRRNGKASASKYFEDGFEKVFQGLCSNTEPTFPITVYYAFKQSETEGEIQASTGWETLLEGMLKAGWTVTATWPMRTERKGRVRDIQSNALASSVVLACRPRPADAGFTDRRGLINVLREEFPDALRKLEQGKVAPVDLRQAAIGPGMAIFSRYARVNEPDGSPMRVRAALSLINQVLDEKLSQLEGSVSPDTRFCVEWFKQFGFDEGPYGTAETLSKGIDTSITGLERGGVLKQGGGKVKLLSVPELPDSYNPLEDERTSEWEICLHLAKALKEKGADGTARLMAAAREVPEIDLDDVKELAYLLYSIAEKKGWAETALLFNNLGTSWTDSEDASRKLMAGAGVGGGQGEFTLEFGSGDDGDE